jgi:hypothetical protein
VLRGGAALGGDVLELSADCRALSQAKARFFLHEACRSSIRVSWLTNTCSGQEGASVLERLQITNFRSIAQATVDLKPFTLLVGANGSGKSNLLALLQQLSALQPGHAVLPRHFNRLNAPCSIELTENGVTHGFRDGEWFQGLPALRSVRVFSIDPLRIGSPESLVTDPEVKPDGAGAIQVLDALKTGDREDLFNKIEATLHDFIPEIEKLSFVPGQSVKSLQVRERHIATPVPLSVLSEGTRLVLTILAIVHQERKPSIICLEDLDRGIHPRLFGQVVNVCRSLVRGQSAVQIIATT